MQWWPEWCWRGGPAVAAGLLVLGLAACSAASSGDAPNGPLLTTSGPAVTASPAPSPGSAASPRVPVTATSTASRSLPDGLTRADLAAGLLSARFSSAGSGRFVTVPGTDRAESDAGRRVRVEIQVEKGLNVDGARFAGFVLATLNDRRSWGHGGARHFDRVDRAGYDVRVVLASPQTSARMCLPLHTFGHLSCHSGDAAVITVYRWVKAIPGYGSDRTGYREYLINHEVGHALGHGHEFCAGPGQLAPVMQQQTKSLQGCRPNPWPYP